MPDMTQDIQVLDGNVTLRQPAKGFRTSLDAVLLAAACPAGAGDRILDMGCGVGSVSFCLLHRVPGCYVTGFDILPDYIALAQDNIALNGAQGHAAFSCAALDQYPVPTMADRFDHVVCNPPFMEAGDHMPSPEQARALANGHQAQEMTVKDWIDKAFFCLKPGGSLTLVHRADRTDRIIRDLGRRFGRTDIIPLWPKAGQDARRVIIRTVRDRKSPCSLRSGLVLHEDDGTYTRAADDILRRAQALV